MAKTKIVKKIIEVPKMTMEQMANTIKEKGNASIQDQVAAYVGLSRLVLGYTDKKGDFHPGFKSYVDELIKRIEETPIAAINQALIDAGLMEEGETPIIKIGDEVEVKLTSKTETKLKIDTKAMSEITTLPDKYKKVTTSLNTDAVKAAFNGGSLEDVFKTYVTSSTTTSTKLTQTRLK